MASSNTQENSKLKSLQIKLNNIADSLFKLHETKDKDLSNKISDQINVATNMLKNTCENLIHNSPNILQCESIKKSLEELIEAHKILRPKTELNALRHGIHTLKKLNEIGEGGRRKRKTHRKRKALRKTHRKQ